MCNLKEDMNTDGKRRVEIGSKYDENLRESKSGENDSVYKLESSIQLTIGTILLSARRHTARAT